MRDRGEMLTIAEAPQRTQLFLTGQMIEAPQAVEYELPSFEIVPRIVQLSVAVRSRVEIRRVPRRLGCHLSRKLLWRLAV
jgi:hypothetical protein